MRPITPALLVLLACSLGCDATPPPTLVVQPAAALLLVGETTVVVARVEGGCSDLASLSVRTADGSAAPAWLDLKVDRFATSPIGYPIANPGSGQPFDVGGGTVFDPTQANTSPVSVCSASVAPGGREFASTLDGFQFAFSAAPGAPSTPTALRVQIAACGVTLDQPLTLSVVGSIGLGAFCGWTSGEACASDAGCTRAGALGQACTAAPSQATSAMPCLACSDPVPTGARCGCVSGVCAWR